MLTLRTGGNLLAFALYLCCYVALAWAFAVAWNACKACCCNTEFVMPGICCDKEEGEEEVAAAKPMRAQRELIHV